MTMLRNKKSDRGVALRFNIKELPYFTLWKNTDTLREGYVTGLEPATGYPYNRAVEREHGRVPKLKPGESQSFTLEYRVLLDKAHVKAAETKIRGIQGSRKTKVNKKPAK